MANETELLRRYIYGETLGGNKEIISVDPNGRLETGWLFGQPSLHAGGLGKANWSTLQTQKGSGISADLYGGVQSGGDWAACYFPVNELPLTQLTSVQWSWYQTATQTMGLGVVIWIHDPTDFDKRAELTQLGGIAGLDKAAGWNAHKLVETTDQFFFYGEGTTGTDLTAGAANLYGLDDFQADTLFKDWVIYRISFDWGWEASGTFESVYLTEVKLNGIYIQFAPTPGGKSYKTINVQKTLDANNAYTANDVMSEDPGAGAGTTWDFSLGGTGKINRVVIVSETTALTAALTLYLYTAPPTCELDDHAANNGPLVADLGFYLGHIKFPAMVSQAGPSYTIASQTIVSSNLPFAFDKPILYGVLVDGTGEDFADDTTLNIIMTAELDG